MAETLSGKVALVTGGGRGIGRTVAQMLAEAGAAVAVMGRNIEALEDSAAAIGAAGGRALAVQGDVIVRGDVLRAVATVEQELGPIDILVNNAGVGAGGGPMWLSDPDAWWWVQEVNLKGPYLMMHAVLGGMVERGLGCVINMGSYQGIHPSSFMGGYPTSKAALMRLTDGAAGEVADAGVTVFCIRPGFVETDMTRDLEEMMRKENPDFEGFDEQYKFPAEASGRLCVRLARGDADKLTGRMIHVRDDLDQMIADADQIIAEDRYALRLNAEIP